MGTEGRYFGPISRIDAAPLFPLLPLVNWITPEAERTLLRPWSVQICNGKRAEDARNGKDVKVTDTKNKTAHAAVVQANAASAYPGESNTGPVPGTVLRTVGTGPGEVSSGPGWEYSGGFVRITGSGTTFNALKLSGFGIGVYASGVTIENCVIAVGGQSTFPVTIQTDANNSDNPIISCTIKNCTISGSDNDMNRAAACIKDTYGNATGLLIQACNLYWASTGIQVYAGHLIGNYIHDLVENVTYGDHVNGITVSGGTGAMLMQGNTILISQGQTDCISLFQDFAPPAIANKTINNNLMAGGGYCIYGGQSGAAYTGLPATNVVITNNQISTMYFPLGGAYGPVAYFTPGNPGNKWSGNAWYDGPNKGKAIPAP
jgi:hypothetical protein